MGRSNIKSVPFKAVITQMFVILFKRHFIRYFRKMRVRSQSSSLRLTQRGRAGRKHSVQSSIFHIKSARASVVPERPSSAAPANLSRVEPCRSGPD